MIHFKTEFKQCIYLDTQLYWAKSQAIKYTLRPINIYSVRYYNNPEQMLRQLLQPALVSAHSYSRSRRIMDKRRTLLSRDVTTMKQFACLNSDYSCSRNKWLLLDQHQIRSVDSAAPSTDCCAIGRWRKFVGIARHIYEARTRMGLCMDWFCICVSMRKRILWFPQT